MTTHTARTSEFLARGHSGAEIDDMIVDQVGRSPTGIMSGYGALNGIGAPESYYHRVERLAADGRLVRLDAPTMRLYWPHHILPDDAVLHWYALPSTLQDRTRHAAYTALLDYWDGSDLADAGYWNNWHMPVGP